MNESLLESYLKNYLRFQKENPAKAQKDEEDRSTLLKEYSGWTPDRIRNASPEDLVPFFAPLWSMAMWGNVEYQVNQIVSDNGLKTLKNRLIDFLWGHEDLPTRWDEFRKNTKWIGPSIMSELLGLFYPDKYIIWNKVTVAALNLLEFSGLPQQSYQIQGQSYLKICAIAKSIGHKIDAIAGTKVNLLEVNFFLWDVLKRQTNEKQIQRPPVAASSTIEKESEKTAKFLHDDVKEKIVEIGKWLGFNARMEIMVSAGSKVDAIWEATIGNMGRVIYVFEVQTKGSIDSLILNLLKSKKNPGVQGVVAVSDEEQLNKIHKHAADVEGLSNLRLWNYQEVLETHARLEAVNETINNLDLVPKGFEK